MLDLSVVLQRDDFELAVDLRADAGESIGIAGGIGAGKSSLLQLITGRLRATSGRLAFDDVVWDEPSRGLFVVPEDRPVTALSQRYHDDLPEDLSGIDIVRGGVERFGPETDRPTGSALERAHEVVAALGVEDHVIERLPWTFSGAEAQRIALAAAVAPRPQAMVLDEPFGAFDRRTRSSVRSWLADWLAGYDGIAVIASTNEDDLAALTDRVHTLD